MTASANFIFCVSYVTRACLNTCSKGHFSSGVFKMASTSSLMVFLLRRYTFSLTHTTARIVTGSTKSVVPLSLDSLRSFSTAPALAGSSLTNNLSIALVSIKALFSFTSYPGCRLFPDLIDTYPQVREALGIVEDCLPLFQEDFTFSLLHDHGVTDTNLKFFSHVFRDRDLPFR